MDVYTIACSEPILLMLRLKTYLSNGRMGLQTSNAKDGTDVRTMDAVAAPAAHPILHRIKTQIHLRYDFISDTCITLFLRRSQRFLFHSGFFFFGVECLMLLYLAGMPGGLHTTGLSMPMPVNATGLLVADGCQPHKFLAFSHRNV